MDQSLQLAIALGRLESRIHALETALERQCGPTEPPQPEPSPTAQEEGAQTGRLLQQGIDNIMSYQWPPKKEEEEQG